ncbi:ATPdependent RNA helicase [Saguinus oedipus]|uniref:ATPdependent RNA helicase n=1 Tax=Saguinus oedipus TaxID=9490 RepID=A0ABQ9U5U2_SAGOE|nr:ATPdependent RNA helicase [Saguinus oedipus]KAK2092165.1 ATPdependent RNA helicase [Saguinus oedipus]KAK2092169.1 ATPdependent RNA helicase [Saguinus oedipus]
MQKLAIKDAEEDDDTEASKRPAKAKDEEEAFLDWSDDDDDDDGGFDPSTLPDPDKYRSSEESDSEDTESKTSDAKKQGMKKRNNSEVEDVGPTRCNRKKAKWDTLEPLDTGLSLAEEEELVLHLLRSQS